MLNCTFKIILAHSVLFDFVFLTVTTRVFNKWLLN